MASGVKELRIVDIKISPPPPPPEVQQYVLVDTEPDLTSGYSKFARPSAEQGRFAIGLCISGNATDQIVCEGYRMLGDGYEVIK